MKWSDINMDCMSSILVECNHCGREYDVFFPQAVTKQNDPDLAKMIVDGDLFYIQCPHCGYVQNIDMPVIYADLEKNAIICYFNEATEFAMAHNYIESQLVNFGIDSKSSFIRVVSTQNELREKVILLDNDFDDRVIEILKLWALERVRNEGYGQKFEEMRCAILEDDYLNIDFIGDKPRHIRIARNYYDRVAKVLRPVLDQVPTPLEVSTEWAVEFDVANSK